MRITIEVPDQTVDARWLREQLKLMQAIGEVVPEGGHAHNPIRFWDYADSEGHTGQDFLLTNDEAYSDDGFFNTRARIIFHTDGTAYVDPEVNEGDFSYSDGRRGDEHTTEWIKGTWADGLLALAQSVVGRLKILDAQQGTEINEALDRLVEVIGDTKAETLELEVEC